MPKIKIEKEPRRSKNLGIRLTEDEFARLKSSADRYGMKISEFGRALMFSAIACTGK